MFACEICGTEYKYEDLAKNCAGFFWYLHGKRDKEHLVFDQIQAEIGERILVTHYVGDDYAPAPFKSGLKKLYGWTRVVDKRIIPVIAGPDFVRSGHRYAHIVQYHFEFQDRDYVEHAKIYRKTIEEFKKSDEYLDLIERDYWVGPDNHSYAVGIALGPWHLWSKAMWGPESSIGADYLRRAKFPERLIEDCYGPLHHNTFVKMLADGYDVRHQVNGYTPGDEGYHPELEFDQEP